MSFTYTKVESSVRKPDFYGMRDYIRVKIDPEVVKRDLYPHHHEFPVCFLPKKYLKWHDRIHNFNIRADDIWVTSFPKSGTTWTINIVIQLLNGIDCSNEFFDNRQWSLEISIQADFNDDNICDENYKNLVDKYHRAFEAKDSQHSPRILKSHLPAHLLPIDIWTIKPKLIYVYRDVRDVAVSFHHMCKGLPQWKYDGPKEDMFEAFLNDHIIYGPYVDHVNSFLKLNESDHVLLLKYEHMLSNSFAAVQKISHFLNYTYNDDQLKRLTEHVSFDNMRNNNIIDKSLFVEGYNFFRKGTAGGYRNEMSTEYIDKFNVWEKQN